MLKCLPPLLAIAAAISLSACEPLAPKGYSKSPAMADYFAQLAPQGYRDTVETVAMCSDDGVRAASVMFKDGNLYHYTVKDGVTVKLEFHTTAAQRNQALANDQRVIIGCVGYYDYSGFRSYHTGGEYRIEVGYFGVAAHAYDSIVINYPFDDEVKAQLKGAALVLQAAIERHKKFVPVETTWGITP